jgi:DNA-binding transcriptional LysR family regulator
VIVNDDPSLIALAYRGVGLVYTPIWWPPASWPPAAWSPSWRRTCRPALFLYSPARTQDQPKLRAFIEVATRRSG